MNKKATSKFLIVIMILFVLFLVAYLVFGDEIKAGFIVYVWKHHPLNMMTYQTDKTAVVLNEFIGKNAGSLFLNPLIKLTKHKKYEIQNEARSTLDYNIRLNPQSADVGKLLSNLKSRDKEIRGISVYLLGYIDRADLIDDIEYVLQNDRDSRVRVNAAVALSRINHKSVIPILIRALKDKHPRVRSAVCCMLGEIRDKSANPALIKMLKDKDDEVRFQAIVALSLIGEPEGIKQIVNMINDKSKKVSRIALIKLGEAKQEYVIDALIKAAHDSKGEKRCKAIDALGGYRDPKIVDVIIEILDELKEDDEYYNYIKNKATIVLGKQDNKKALEIIKKHLDDPDSSVRESAIFALNNYNDKSVVPYLIKIYDKSNFEGQFNILSQLGSLGDKRAVPLLIKALNDKETCFLALSALSEFNDKKINKIVIKFIEKNKMNFTKHDIGNVARSLSNISSPESAELASYFLSETRKPYEIIIIIELLEKSGDSKCIPPLENLLDQIEKEIKNKVEKEKKRRLIDGDIKKYEAEIRARRSDVVTSAKKAIRVIREREQEENSPGKDDGG